MLWVAGGNPRPPALSDNPVMSIAQFSGASTLDINVRLRSVKIPEYSKIVLDDAKKIFFCQFLGADDYNSI